MAKTKTDTSSTINSNVENDNAANEMATPNIKSKNSDDIAPGIRKTYEFTAAFRNGYSDGTVKQARQKLKADMLVQK